MRRTLSIPWGGRTTVLVDPVPESLPVHDPPDGVAPHLEQPMVAGLTAPDLLGMSSQDARRITRLSDLVIEIDERPTSSAPWGRVLRQTPEPGTALTRGDVVTIVISAKPRVVVPDISGDEEGESLDVLRGAGLVPARRVVRQSDRVPEGCIVKTRPRAGSSVVTGTRVSYIVAAAPRRRAKPRRRDVNWIRAQRLPDGSFTSGPERG